MHIDYYTFSRTGRRKCNEDYVRVAEGTERTLFVLCDGMGGHAMGEYASKTVGDAIVGYWQNHPEEKDSEEKVHKAIHKAFVALDEESFALGHVEMGSTLVMASIEQPEDPEDLYPKLTVAHIGDSRCYVLRRGYSDWDKFIETGDDKYIECEEMYRTEDHVDLSYGGERVAKCFFSYHPEVAVPDIREFYLQPGDVIFLCSDGVCKYVRPDILQERLLDCRTAAEIGDVIEFLCEKESDDNYSGIVIQMTE